AQPNWRSRNAMNRSWLRRRYGRASPLTIVRYSRMCAGLVAPLHGRVVGIVDAVLAGKDGSEAQCEVRAVPTLHSLYLLTSVVSLGRPVWSQRILHAAWNIEDVQRAFASMTLL